MDQKFLCGEKVRLTDAAVDRMKKMGYDLFGMVRVTGEVIGVDMNHILPYQVKLYCGITEWFKGEELDFAPRKEFAFKKGDRVRLNEHVTKVASYDCNDFTGLRPGLEGAVIGVIENDRLSYLVELSNGDTWWFRETVLEHKEKPVEEPKQEPEEGLSVTEVFCARVGEFQFQRAAGYDFVEVLRQGEYMGILTVQEFKDVVKILRI